MSKKYIYLHMRALVKLFNRKKKTAHKFSTLQTKLDFNVELKRNMPPLFLIQDQSFLTKLKSF